ncbi:hypothetical protein COT42_03370 [Candidatus Saganbacteria bacterium CG08_land_8_20_14_0_20_45_16]|uniref:GGDEF domain-containing protein n=1 Tax=Candidatus Saganbacteria bacterium CG08_land_8_20_14_0_20_45_16 TaxID=2014293 RepID=A0A2H0XZ34_UNCSA|nr:MAG: hypothetical protein COT42_03370 [Candidatus Saganbacteria bacterium CG08_land_8_20_14_0_20_45_16]
MVAIVPRKLAIAIKNAIRPFMISDPRAYSYLSSNLRLLLPKVTLSGKPNPQISARYARPFVTLLTLIAGVAVSGDDLFQALAAQGVFASVEADGPTVDEGDYRDMVWWEGKILAQDHFNGSFNRWAGLQTFTRSLLANHLSATGKLDLIVGGIRTVSRCSGVRVYELTTDSSRNWTEISLAGDAAKVSSRFAAEGVQPEPWEEKAFLHHTILEILRGTLYESAIREYLQQGAFTLQHGENWAIFYIPDRSRCNFIDENKIAVDEKTYGLGNVDEIAFLIIGDPRNDQRVKVFQLTKWGEGSSLLINDPKVDLPMLKALAETLAEDYKNEKLVGIDGLTGLWARSRLKEKLVEELVRGLRSSKQCLSVVMFDLDRFKLINDNYGHSFGDVALRQLAKAVKQRVRRTDVIIRYGGEEFLAILPEANVENAGALAEDIRRAVQKIKLMYGTQRVFLSVSLGIAGISGSEAIKELLSFLERDGGEDSDAWLVKAADQALYRAKEGCGDNPGRNQTVVFQRPNEFQYLRTPEDGTSC